MNQPPVKPPRGPAIIKTVFGVLFILAGFGMDTIAQFFVGLVIGSALLAWAFLPFKRYKQELADFEAGKTIAVGKPSIGYTVFKAAVGALFILVPFDTGESTSIAVGFFLGVCCFVWAAYPYLKHKKSLDAAPPSVKKNVERMKPANAGKKRNPQSCPYCGAPMTGDLCEYCGMYSE